MKAKKYSSSHRFSVALCTSCHADIHSSLFHDRKLYCEWEKVATFCPSVCQGSKFACSSSNCYFSKNTVRKRPEVCVWRWRICVFGLRHYSAATLVILLALTAQQHHHFAHQIQSCKTRPQQKVIEACLARGVKHCLTVWAVRGEATCQVQALATFHFKGRRAEGNHLLIFNGRTL